MAVPTAAPGFLRPPAIDSTGLTDAQIIARWGHPAGDGDCRYDTATNTLIFYSGGALKRLAIDDLELLAGESAPDQWHEFRSSEVATLPRLSPFTGATIGTLSTGRAYAARALCKADGTYTQIRFMTGATPPSGTYTDMRAGVWNDAGTVLLASTANAFATVTQASTLYTLSLGAGVELEKGDEVFLGLGFIASTQPTIRGAAAGAADLLSLAPALARINAGGSWTTGNALSAAMSTTNATAMPWVELLP